MDMHGLQDSPHVQDVVQMPSHKILDFFAFAHIGGAIWGALQYGSGVFVSIAALAGLGLTLYRGYLARKEDKEHDEDRIEKKAQKLIAEKKLREIEQYALTDKEKLSRAEMAKITADGNYTHTQKDKK